MRFGDWLGPLYGRPVAPLSEEARRAEQVQTVIAKHRAWYRHRSRAEQDAIIIEHIGWEAFALYGGGKRVADHHSDHEQ